MLHRLYLLFVLMFAQSTVLASAALAQSQDIDIRAKASRVKGDALIEAFSGVTHNGAYNFSSEGRASSFYTETHLEGGAVKYTEDGRPHDGDWAVFRDQLCYSYDEADMPGGCFRVYKVGTCFYFYSATLIKRRDELDRDYWTARSVQDGDEPTCEAVFS